MKAMKPLSAAEFILVNNVPEKHNRDAVEAIHTVVRSAAGAVKFLNNIPLQGFSATKSVVQ
jgi:hypothetical protein